MRLWWGSCQYGQELWRRRSALLLPHSSSMHVQKATGCWYHQYAPAGESLQLGEAERAPLQMACSTRATWHAAPSAEGC